MARRNRPTPWYRDVFKLLAVFSTGFTILNFGALILFWNWAGAARNVDSLSVSITVLEIFLAVIAVGGFFVIRGAAMKSAEEEAKIVAEDVTKSELQEIAPPMVNRAVLAYMSLLEQESGTVSTTDSINELMQALDDGGPDA